MEIERFFCTASSTVGLLLCRRVGGRVEEEPGCLPRELSG
jgi:hypothetical protein